MIKATALVIFAIMIDAMQALISAGIAIVASFPGTAGGGIFGCFAGKEIAGEVGCAVVGILGAVVATPLDAAAPYTIPLGIALGFAINICLSATFGSILLLFMTLAGYKPSVKYLWGGIGEMLPGVNNIPFWTALVILTVIKKSAKKGMSSFMSTALSMTSLMSPTGAFGKATGAVMQVKEGTVDIARQAPPRVQTIMRQMQPQDFLSKIRGAPEDLAEERAARRTQNIMRDIRPLKTLAIACLMFVGAQFANAQGIDPVQFTITPENPTPGQQVTIDAQGIGSFLGNSTITWQKDGKTELTGKGEHTFSFTAGGLGAQTRIHVTIVSSEKGTITRDFSFIPSSVNLVWEASTSVPPMYRGKALYSAGSVLRVIAFPSIVAGGATVSSNNLSFQWSRNGNPAPANSGLGRNTFTFQGDQLKKNENIIVDVYLGNVKVARGTIVIPAVSPSILFYSRDPLRGVLYDSALPSSVSLATNEVTLQAQPYFFSNTSINNALTYQWKLNGKETSGPDASRGGLTLRQSGSGAGQATLTLAIQNTDAKTFTQIANAALQIAFGETTSASSIFGL
ncbi:hypothetical protein H7X87_04405 [Acetobacteraceae bacterium]|nr:hypothetical protein [Candidatus Parcubacteria bacterium]